MYTHERAYLDTLSLFAIQIKRAGVVVDLTDRVVKFVMYNEDGDAVVAETSANVSISAPLQGMVEYDFQSADFADFAAELAEDPDFAEKTYAAYFKVYNDSETEADTYPASDEPIYVTIFNPAKSRTTTTPNINIIEAANSPLRVRTAEGTVQERSIDELIKADRYNQAQQMDAVPWGMRIAKTKPPSTLS